MAKWFFVGCTAVLSLALAMSQVQGQDKGKQPEKTAEKKQEKSDEKAPEKKLDALAADASFFPIKVGSSWEYASGGKKVVVKVAAHEKVGDVMCARFETSTDGGAFSEHVAVKSDGVFKFRANGQNIEPPLLMLKLPAKKGDSWSVKSEVQGYSIFGKYAVSEEKISVEKVDYTTISVKSSDLILAGRLTMLEDFYAKDVGLIRKTVKMPDAQIDVVIELVKFTPGN
jgi:hypothetical protein